MNKPLVSTTDKPKGIAALGTGKSVQRCANLPPSPPTHHRVGTYQRPQEVTMIGKDVLVRTYSAGVHVGTLKSKEGKEVTLNNARRIMEAIEIIPINDKARASISNVPVWED